MGVGLSKKKVEPQFGVSFGLPYPTNGYPLNTFNGGQPAPNPYFGSISPNGLNLGLVNVNPLVSFQFAKNEYGEKLFKPLVNLHVTPNENIIHKVGNLFKAKKYGTAQGLYNQHYHTHTHFPAPPPIYHPHHYESGHFGGGSEYHASGPGNGHFGLSSPGPYGLSGPGGYYGASGPGGYYRESPTDSFYPSGPTGPAGPVDYNYNGFYSRSLNATQADGDGAGFVPSANDYQNTYPNNQQNQLNDPSNSYANNYNDYNNNQNVPNQNENRQSQSVSFPSSRRKRSSGNDNDSPTQKNAQGQLAKIVNIEKVR